MAGEAVFESVANWFRTLRLVVFDRRALLLGAPTPTPPPVPPLKFMLSAAALLYGVNAIVALQAPAMELPGSVSMLRQLVGLVSDLPSALTFGGALLSAVMLFAFFRLFRIPLSWEAIWRQVAFNTGAQVPGVLLLLVPAAIWKSTLHVATPAVFLLTALIWFASYSYLLVWLFRQCADEAAIRPWRAALPYSLALVPVFLVTAWVADAIPELWVTGVYWMSPGILPDDPVHVDRWVFLGRDPRPGEVVELSPKTETALPIVPLGGALRTAALPVTRRIIAVPGDTVAGHGAQIMVNGALLPREAVTQALGERPDPNRTEFYERLGERRFIVRAGKNESPVTCLSAAAQRVPDGMFLVAADERPDGQGFCGLVMRARLRGLVDWNARSRAVP